MQPLWRPTPDQIKTAQITAFRALVAKKHMLDLPDYAALHEWSITELQDFWNEVWDFCGIMGEKGTVPYVTTPDDIEKAQFFPGARLNFAQNLLAPRPDDAPAMIFVCEDNPSRTVSYGELCASVAAMAAHFKAIGIQPGDRIAGYLPNIPEAVMAMLAAAAIGAVWTACSPDFGSAGVIDRFGQVAPKVLITVDGYIYGQKSFDIADRLPQIMDAIPSLSHLIVVPYLSPAPQGLPAGADLWPAILQAYAGAKLEFAQLPFNHPVYILYSSGTTGAPKCIVHGAGGTLLQHVKEHRLHCDIRPGEKIFYYTTCSWMMWHWLVSALASQATIVLYEGSPASPSLDILFTHAQNFGVSLFGTSAKFIEILAKKDVDVTRSHDLSALRMIASTGSPLSPEGFDYIYKHIHNDVCLASISGGTDIISCFALGNATLPVYAGELQCLGLGMGVAVYNDQGKEVPMGEAGELVCTRAFPSRPIGFWNDADRARYRHAYFDLYPGVWHHGDFVRRTDHGGLIIYGRSDTVLNPGGVRIGSAEIYRQVEKVDEVMESICVGQRWQNDERVVLFVKLRDGIQLDRGLEDKIRKTILKNTTPRHVPAVILQVQDIPRTKNGKISEMAVKHIVNEMPVKNVEALANPEILKDYQNLAMAALTV